MIAEYMATRTARIVLMCAAGVVLALLLAIGFKPAAAQTQKEEPLSFDVVSIKPLAFEPVGAAESVEWAEARQWLL